MTLKNILMTSAAALILSGPAFAQETDAEVTADLDCAVEEGTPLPEGCEAEGDATADADLATEGTAADMAEDMGETDMDGEDEMTADAEAGTDMETDDGAMAETDMETDMETDEGDMAETDMETDMETETDGAMAETDMDGDMGMENDISAFVGMTVADIVGLDVHNELNNDVGEIDYVIQGASGYEAVIGIGGLLGLGEYTVALPLSEYTLTMDDNGEPEMLVVRGYTEEELEAMPEIDESALEALEGDHVISE